MEDMTLTQIPIEQIYPNPDNPRKDLGDLSELVEDIRKNGIMQNLTVIRDGADRYKALIGHRRLAAARIAGIKTVPAKVIEEMDRRDQIARMAAENMQRQDLTVWEEAECFQLMLDLGETAKSISEKTNKSESTVRRRLQIAKLDKEKVNKATSVYQISLSDLEQLEKVKSIETRNAILDDARDSNQITMKVQAAVKTEERRRFIEIQEKILEEVGIKPAPKGTKYYDPGIEKVISYDFGPAAPKKLAELKDDDLMYIMPEERIHWENLIYIVKKREIKEEKKTPEKTQDEKNRDKVRKIMKEIDNARRESIMTIVEKGVQPVENPNDVIKEIWGVMIESADSWINLDGCLEYLSGKELHQLGDDEKAKLKQSFDDCGTDVQMLIALACDASEYKYTIMDFRGRYSQSTGTEQADLNRIMEYYGHTTTDDQWEILTGDSDLYKKE